MHIKRHLPSIFLFLLAGYAFSQTAQENNADDPYQCLPCGFDCDKTMYRKPGECPHCGMELVKISDVTFKSIQPSEICTYIAEHPDVVLLDVRTREEFEGKLSPEQRTLKNAINIPVQELEKRLPEIAHLKDREIIVFCSQSHRSPRASYLLTSNGFADVSNMEGGLTVMKDNACKK